MQWKSQVDTIVEGLASLDIKLLFEFCQMDRWQKREIYLPIAHKIIDFFRQIKVFICVQFETISQSDPGKKLSLSTIDEAGANGAAAAALPRLPLEGSSSDRTAVGTLHNSTF